MEFVIKGNTYRIAKLGTFDQWKVSRKLAPLLAGIFSEIGNVRELMPAEGGGDFEKLAPAFNKILPLVADRLSELSDEDSNAIIFPCLAVAARRHMNAWAPVTSQGVIAFDDIDMIVMLTLVARVVADSVLNFLLEPGTSVTPTLTQD